MWSINRLHIESYSISRKQYKYILHTQLAIMRFVIAAVLLICSCFQVPKISGDIGTASSYDPPYLPTKCKGYNQDKFPQSGHIIAASEGLWDNGAACGRRYRIRCISGPKRPCKDGSIVVEVIDFCQTKPCPATLLLSNKAFDAISRFPNAKINVEYAQI